MIKTIPASFEMILHPTVQSTDPEELDHELFMAALDGDRNRVFELIDLGGDPHTALNAAIRGERLEQLEDGTQKRYSHIELIRELIQIRRPGSINFEELLSRAAEADHLDLVKLFLELGASDLNQALIRSAQFGSPELFHFLTTAGATNLNEALLKTIALGIEQDFLPKIQVLLDAGATNLSEAFILASAERRNRVSELLTLLLERQKFDLPILNKALARASEGNNRKAIDFLLEQGANDLGRAAIRAARTGNSQLVRELIERGGGIEQMPEAAKEALMILELWGE